MNRTLEMELVHYREMENKYIEEIRRQLIKLDEETIETIQKNFPDLHIVRIADSPVRLVGTHEEGLALLEKCQAYLNEYRNGREVSYIPHMTCDKFDGVKLQPRYLHYIDMEDDLAYRVIRNVCRFKEDE